MFEAMFANDPNDAGLWSEVRRVVDAQPPPVRPTSSTPTPELIASLSGPHGAVLLPDCARALVVGLGDRDRSYGYLHKLCGEVVKGERRPPSLVVPLEKTWEMMENGVDTRGRPIGNPAAIFVKAVQRFDLEYGPLADDPRKERPAGGHPGKFPAGRLPGGQTHDKP